MSNITCLPPFAKTVRMEVEIPVSQRDEFERVMIKIVAGERPRMDALDRDLAAIKSRADAALRTIEQVIDDNPTIGQSRRLVRFLAGLYNGQNYPFDLTDLRGLDTRLATPAWITSTTTAWASPRSTSISQTESATYTA